MSIESECTAARERVASLETALQVARKERSRLQSEAEAKKQDLEGVTETANRLADMLDKARAEHSTLQHASDMVHPGSAAILKALRHD
jgi:predicted  nucleic acid-binding Zn-ribbon protein